MPVPGKRHKIRVSFEVTPPGDFEAHEIEYIAEMAMHQAKDYLEVRNFKVEVDIEGVRRVR